MSYNDLARKLEEAARTVGESLVSGVACYTGSDDADLQTNAIIVAAGAGDEDPPSTGNYHMPLEIRVVSAAADMTLEDHRTRVATVFDAFMDSALAAVLSAAVSDFFCYEARPAGHSTDNNEQQFVDVLTLQTYCCASDL